MNRDIRLIEITLPVGKAKPVAFARRPAGGWRSDALVAVRRGSGRTIYPAAINLSDQEVASGKISLRPDHLDPFREMIPTVVGWADRPDLGRSGPVLPNADRANWDSDGVSKPRPDQPSAPAEVARVALGTAGLPGLGWGFGPRFSEALATAARLHAGQFRNRTAIPYVSHPLGVCAIALEQGANEEQAIAALLHDVLEDVRPLERARAEVAVFGPEVLRIVEACTDTFLQPKPPWRARKTAYLAHLAESDSAVCLVACSDKLHNARAIAADLRSLGSIVWERFSEGRSGVTWYYRALVGAFARSGQCPTALLRELDRTVSAIEELGREI